MKVVVEKLDPLKRALRFEVPKERVGQAVSEALDRLAKKARIKGFRPGKAPRPVVEREYGALAREEAVKSLIPAVYKEGLGREHLDPVGLPEIEDVTLKDGGMTFTAVVEIKPEVKIGRYKGIHVRRPSSRVTAEELDKTLEYFRTSRGEDVQAPVDDAFARRMGYPDVEAFKASLTRQLEWDKDRRSRAEVERQIVEALLKESRLAVPQGMVAREVHRRIEALRAHLREHGTPEEEIRKREESARAEIRKAAERDVKLYFIFDKIREMEGLSLKDGESLQDRVMAFLLEEARWDDAESAAPKEAEVKKGD